MVHARIPTPTALRGHVFDVTPYERERLSLLELLGLSVPTKICAVHRMPFALVSSPHGTSADSSALPGLLCAQCIFEHKGRDSVDIARHAAIVRGQLQQGAKTLSDGVQISRVRALAQSSAIGIDALPRLADEALEQCASARDAVIAAASERYTNLETQINEAVSQLEAALTSDMRVSDDVIERAATLASNVHRAAVIFDDVDAATSGKVLIDAVCAVEADAAGIVAAPRMPPFVATAMGSALDDIVCAVRQLGVVARTPEQANAAAATHASFPLLEAAAASARAEAVECRTRLSAVDVQLEAAHSTIIAERAAADRRIAEVEAAAASRVATAEARASSLEVRERMSGREMRRRRERCYVLLSRRSVFCRSNSQPQRTMPRRELRLDTTSIPTATGIPDTTAILGPMRPSSRLTFSTLSDEIA